MEYLKVIFPEDGRRVLIDGKRNGTTNVVIEVDAGTHTVSLVPPLDFMPKEQQVVLEPNETGSLSPKEVTFAKI
jgi:hypothetical protein